MATRSIPIVSNLFKSFAISILVPTPSVLVTMWGSFNFFGIGEIAPNPPIFLKSPLLLDFLESVLINLTKLSAFVILTPLFLYVNLFDAI